jgi:plasmid stabilization system protein ParE
LKREVRLRTDAERELRDAIDWYDSQRPGLGEELLDEVDAVLECVAESATSFPAVVPPFRRALLKRFPYAVYFRETDDSVQVFAVFHARRDPRGLRRTFER